MADSSLLIGSCTIVLGTQLIIDSGELHTPLPKSSAKINSLDRSVLDSFNVNDSDEAKLFSDVIVGSALGWAVLGAGLTWIQDDSREAMVDFVLYSETAAITMALTNLVKLAVRRPRPSAYLSHQNDSLGTDQSLSFYSGHVAMVASIGAAATTIAFQRKRPAWQRWLTLGVSVALTTWVAVERVKAKAHFPTDVLVGAGTGAAIGILVPVLHRKFE
jgi:hypothetical protein